MSPCDFATVKCSICGRPYKIWSTKSGDQSACPRCQEEARRASDDNRPDTWEEYLRRQKFFYGEGGNQFVDPRSTHYYIKSPSTDTQNEPNFHPEWGSFGSFS